MGMKTDRKTGILVAVALLAGLFAGWLIFGERGVKTPDGFIAANSGATVWTCSMHPQIRQNEPGDCPICGMDLIVLESHEQADENPVAVTMSPAAMKLARVATARVSESAPVKSVRLNGKVQADQRLVFSQTSHIPGRIEKLLVNFTGDRVTRGQTLALVYSPELVTAQEELFLARKTMDTQPELFRAAREKLKNWKLSDSRIDAILKSGTVLTRFPVDSDVTGFVAAKRVNPGDYIERGQVLLDITDLSRAWVFFDVYESDLPWVKKGNRVEFTVPALPGQVFYGSIAWLDPVIDPQTRVARARVDIPNTGYHLKPEMFVQGRIESRLPGKTEALTIPRSAVMWTGERSLVYVADLTERGLSFAMREVTLGPALGDSVVILKGLEKGEEIAVSGTFSIDAAAQLSGKPSMMSPKGSEKPPTGHDHGKSVSAESPSLPSDQGAIPSIPPLIDGYLVFKDALVRDDLQAAKKAADSLKALLGTIDTGSFPENKKDRWLKIKADLTGFLDPVPQKQTIEDVRKVFQSASVTMINLARDFKPMDSPLYIQHCPMADQEKGADWLSREKEIRNPYFGKSMLTCGEVTDTLK